MRYSFLDVLACPVTKEPLVLVASKEIERSIPQPYSETTERITEPGSVVGHVPDVEAPTDLWKLLKSKTGAPSDPKRNFATVITEGILVSAQSGRWYPIIDEIPEVLPDSLRNWERDFSICRSLGETIGFLKGYLTPDPFSGGSSEASAARPGDHHKHAEMNILSKLEIEPHLFLGPGYVSPFNPGTFYHSSDLIRGFSCSLPFLKINVGSRILDSGSGYSWTTEWFMKMGVKPVGIEISRVYLDVARRRMNANQPHLVVGDAESLPFLKNSFDAVIGFDAFHHIPNRDTAMAEYSRVLKSKGRVVLVEPGSAHEHAPGVTEIMEKYGTLERGMDLSDVQSYIRGVRDFEPAQEIFIAVNTSGDQRTLVPTNELRDRRFIGWSMFSIDKNALN